MYDDENGDTKYSVQSFLFSPEELTLLKPMHIWTNAYTANGGGGGGGGGDQAVDMNMFNQLSEAGIVVGSRFEVSDMNVDALLQNTINEQIILKFAESVCEFGFGCGGDAKESATVLMKTLFEKVKTLIGMVEQEPRNVISMAVNGLTNGALTNGESDGIDIHNHNKHENKHEHAVNQCVDLHLMDLISRTVIDCIHYQGGAIACENGGGQRSTNPLLYEIISQVLTKNLTLYRNNANSLGRSEVSFTAIEQLLASPEATLQIENQVKMLAAKSMQTNKVDLIKAMINGSINNHRAHNEIHAEIEQSGGGGGGDGGENQPQTENRTAYTNGTRTQHDEVDILEHICGLLRNETIDELHESVRNLICHEATMRHHIVTEMQKQTDKLVNEAAIAQILRKCIVSAVQQLTNDDIQQIVATPGPVAADKLSAYLTDTISLARALGLTNCILHLSNLMNGNGDVAIEQLESDTETFELLQRVIVMHKLSQHDKKREKALALLRNDPYSARGDIVLRELLRCSGICTLNLEEGKQLTDSNDVPISLIYSQNQLAIEDFFLRTQTKPRGGAILIVKDRFQAVVPRESSRDVLTGKCAYTVLDENGIRHFEPLHMFTALKLKNVTMFANRFASYSADNETEKTAKNALNNGFDIDIDHILNMGAMTTASNNGFIAYKSTILPRKEYDLYTKHRRYGAPPHELILDRNQVNYRRSFYL